MTWLAPFRTRQLERPSASPFAAATRSSSSWSPWARRAEEQDLAARFQPSHIPGLFLIGFRASGKSTLGPLLAKRLSRQFLDTDELLEQSLGCTIAECFARFGEHFFRDRESCCLQDVARRIAAGEELVV